MNEAYLNSQFNKKCMDETTKLFDDFSHRIKLMDKLSKEIESLQESNNRTVLTQKDFFEKEIHNLQVEMLELSNNTKQLVKAVYDLGKILKDKVSTRELDKVKELVDNWKLEEFIQHGDLEQTFSNYKK